MAMRKCPNCVVVSGMMQLLQDMYGKYWDCLQCGHIIYLETITDEELAAMPRGHSTLLADAAVRLSRPKYYER